MPFRVTCPLVLARDHRGRTHHRYKDEVIKWLPDNQRAHLIELGLVEEIGLADIAAAELAQQRLDEQADEAAAERAQECAAVLDEIGIPLSAGAPKARTELRVRGHKFANAVVAAALRLRRERAGLSGMTAMPRTQRIGPDMPVGAIPASAGTL